MSRHIENFCRDQPFYYADQVTDGWLKESAIQVINKMSRYSLSRPERGPYTGDSGVYLALLEAERAFAVTHPVVNSAHFRSRLPEPTTDTSHWTSYLGGALGDAVVLTLCGQPLKHGDMHWFLDRCVQYLTSDVAKTPDEILYGRAGFLAAVKTLERRTGHALIDKSKIRSVIRVVILKGRLGARLVDGPPLFWTWHDTGYLGGAHGVAGILQALLLYYDLLDDREQEEVSRTAEWLLSLEEHQSGHWESSIDYVRSSREKRLVHWCHGAPGVVGCLVVAYRVLGKQAYLEAAIRAGALIWEEGVLRKGPGLCHGVAGNGLTLLTLYHATGDERWKTRAKCFAFMMMDSSVQRQQRTPDTPISLFEGWSGGLSFLTALTSIDKQDVFPLIPV